MLKSLKVQKHPFFLSRTWRNILNQGETSTGAMVLLNEHGDLYFLSHQNSVHIILLNLEKKMKKFVGRKKRYSRNRAQNRYSTEHANYDHENNNYTNALRPRCFKLCDIVLYAPHFPLPVKFFPKCYFNKVCLELPQNLT